MIKAFTESCHERKRQPVMQNQFSALCAAYKSLCSYKTPALPSLPRPATTSAPHCLPSADLNCDPGLPVF